MSRWLHDVYDDYQRGHPDVVAGIRTLQKRVRIGQASQRDISLLKGLDRIHITQEQPNESAVFISDTLLQLLLDLIAQARRPASVNLMTAGTSPMRRHGGMQISGAYDGGPFFGAHGGGGGGRAMTTSAPHPSGGGFHHGGGHGGFHRGGGGVWFGPWSTWPDDCYADSYGRIWCWTPAGWQVVA